VYQNGFGYYSRESNYFGIITKQASQVITKYLFWTVTLNLLPQIIWQPQLGDQQGKPIVLPERGFLDVSQWPANSLGVLPCVFHGLPLPANPHKKCLRLRGLKEKIDLDIFVNT
jgi:hypothetical protein